MEDREHHPLPPPPPPVKSGTPRQPATLYNPFLSGQKKKNSKRLPWVWGKRTKVVSKYGLFFFFSKKKITKKKK